MDSCVVTGGARGIGRGIAERMVGRGYAVVVTDVDGDGARRTAAEIGAAAGLAHDVRDPAGHRFIATTALDHGRLTAWFNNAGVGDDGRLVDLSDEQVQRLVEVNLLGCLWGMRAAMAAFDPRGGDVVNIASLSGLGPVPGYAVYAATKAAVVSVTMSVSAEVPAGVRVHALCPDGVQTAMLDAQDHEAVGSQLVHSGGRILTVDETADAAVALLGTRRVVRSLPGWRGALTRSGGLAPSVAKYGTSLFAARGARVIARRAAGRCARTGSPPPNRSWLTAGRRRGSAGGIATRRKSFEHLFVSLLETVRTPALPSYMCSIERLIGPPPGPTVGGHH